MTTDGETYRLDMLDRSPVAALVARLRHLGHVPPELEHKIRGLARRIEVASARTLLQSEDDPVRRPRYVLSGWACRFRLLSDGRRQVFDLILPGDGLGVCLRPTPLAHTSTVALTRVEMVDAEELLSPAVLQTCPELVSILEAAADLDERRMLNHIVRLGRMTALERLGHLLLELHERLTAVGHAEGDRFPLPLTQEILADSLGLSVVHVNRTLQELRRQGLMQLDRGEAWLRNRAGLEALVDYVSMPEKV